jgi:hypothetical protein
MKKIILGLTIGLLIISCSSSDDNSSSLSGVYKWQFKLNGVLYQWEGTFLNPQDGGGSYNSINNKGFLTLVKTTPSVSLFIDFPNVVAGTSTFNSSSPETEGFLLILPDGASYDTSFGGSMNVNITSLSSTTQVTNPLNPGKVIGTFSGTIKKADSQTTYSITEGVFEVPRTQ